jgi:NADH-quinone oxidoreductase subunit C
MTPEQLHDQVVRRLPDVVAAQVDLGMLTVDVTPDAWLPALLFARDELECDYFDWLSAVDELGRDDSQIRVVSHVYSTVGRHHLLLRTALPRERPRLASATAVYKGANWHERETFEMFGVIFDGHPNLIPLLLPDGFEGHPLRKDFVLASRVAKQWPGEVDPGQSVSELAHGRRRRNLPPGVPDPDTWGPAAPSRETPSRDEQP